MALFLTLFLIASCQRASPPTTSPPPADGQTVVITLTAQGLTFDQSQITVPAGAKVNVFLVNNERLVAHNFAVYESTAATKAIFQGQYVNGGKSTSNDFTAPQTQGSYYFRCDAHPTLMHGEFITTASENK
ncbi:MAG: cupredoxin domain-containing protein [Chloroflexi bacterium]|nr:cupredoxin domain-containing protein [Chloroflexota bacterium]